MLSPKARKVIALFATILTASLISLAVLVYLLFLSPGAKFRSLEQTADNNFESSRDTISKIATIAEVEHRTSGLEKAAAHNADETKATFIAIKAAKSNYLILNNKFSLSPRDRARIELKIKASDHLIRSLDKYKGWIKEAKTAVTVIKYSKFSLEQQSSGLDLLNQAISQLNSGNNKEALVISSQVKETFSKARDQLALAQSKHRDQSIAQLKLISEYYIDAGKALEGMAKTKKTDTDTYNKYVEILNKTTRQAAKMAQNNPITKDFNSWLENNFYYEGGQLIFHYKKALETWPR